MNDACDHAVGMATENYHGIMLRASANGTYGEVGTFSAFCFCPYCGTEIALQANIVEQRIINQNK